MRLLFFVPNYVKEQQLRSMDHVSYMMFKSYPLVWGGKMVPKIVPSLGKFSAIFTFTLYCCSMQIFCGQEFGQCFNSCPVCLIKSY